MYELLLFVFGLLMTFTEYRLGSRKEVGGCEKHKESVTLTA